MPSVLEFPDHPTLLLAMTSGLIPADVLTAPVRMVESEDGRVSVEVESDTESWMSSELSRLGVSRLRLMPSGPDRWAGGWLPLLRLTPAPESLNTSERTPILFELPAGASLRELVLEMLRQGNDRQSYRLVSANGAADERMLLKVVGPPYYSLLRAISADGRSQDGSAGAPEADPAAATICAYREESPGVWTEIGWSHPLASRIEPPPGQFVLLRAPHDWQTVADGRFRDIYELTGFELPEEDIPLQDSGEVPALSVPLRLTASSDHRPAELWVLQGDGFAQLNAFVQSADSQLLSRLSFAVVEPEDGTSGERTILLRARMSREAPPVLVLEARSFCTYLRLPNLFLPTGTRLHPPIRRDVVKRLLTTDDDRITWLEPTAENGFVPRSIDETAFRDLHEWVEYVLDQAHEPLQAWMQSTQFDFEPFICVGEPAPRRESAAESKPQPKKKPRKSQSSRPEKESQPVTKQPAAAEETTPDTAASGEFQEVESLVRTERPKKIEARLRALEAEFRELDLPLDAPQRTDMWRRMAQLNGALRLPADGRLCWANALWETREQDPRSVREWRDTELRGAGTEGAAGSPGPFTLQAVLAAEHPTPTQLNQLAAWLICVARMSADESDAESASLSELQPQLSRLQQVLEKNESFLSVRVTWLAWSAFAKLAGDDVLALARARDRLLERLYQDGLSQELDLPGFLRFSAPVAGERFRIIREQVTRLRDIVQEWFGKRITSPPQTAQYADFLFAFALARLGETQDADRLWKSAQKALSGSDPVHNWLALAFEFRIWQILTNRQRTERFPEELLQLLEEMPRLQRYKIDRLRQHSQILEPDEKIDPYRRWHNRFPDDLTRELALLHDVSNRIELSEKLQQLIATHADPENTGTARSVRVITTALELAPRIGESFAQTVLPRVEPLMEQTSDILAQALLLEKALFTAAHFDQTDDVHHLVRQFEQLLNAEWSLETLRGLEPLLEQCFRGLRKLGLREPFGRLLTRIEALARQTLAAAANAEGDEDPTAGNPQVDALRMLLHVAAGRFYFSEDGAAWPILNEVRNLLLQGDLEPQPRKNLAVAYIVCLGHVPAEKAVPRLEELFRQLEGISDTFTTGSHFSLSQLDLVEAVVTALVGDNFELDESARRWLEDDEFLIRRRIHHDVRLATESAGLS